MTNTTLRLDSSARTQGSLTRELTQYIADRLAADHIIHRDLADTELPLITEDHISAYYTPADRRTLEQQQLLKISDGLIDELKAAKQLVIGAPMYNFSVPAALKAWIDLVCRAGETFAYTQQGPKGLLSIERAFIVVATGGTPIGSPVDFSSSYLQQVCKFIGVKESFVIDVSASKSDPETALVNSKQQIDKLLQSDQVAA